MPRHDWGEGPRSGRCRRATEGVGLGGIRGVAERCVRVDCDAVCDVRGRVGFGLWPWRQNRVGFGSNEEVRGSWSPTVCGLVDAAFHGLVAYDLSIFGREGCGSDLRGIREEIFECGGME